MSFKQFFRCFVCAGLLLSLVGCANQMVVPPSVSKVEKRTYDLGVQAYNERRYDKALDIWLDLADQGDVAALNALGMMYQSGKGVGRDVGAAARLYKKAAVAGLPAAQNNLAVLYEGGEGVPQDLVKAVDLYRRAAEQGHVWAQYNLGRLHVSGAGVEKDEMLASDLFIQAEHGKMILEDGEAKVPDR